ncbi:MAG: hypothetical protein KDA87_23800, partial [Planctomycetales bacterium]|nr:hypothetical protein [Planctomycetales bacterium]
MMNVFPNQHLESIVEAFEAVRAEGPVNDLRVHFLDAQHNDFLPLAVELLRIDMEYGWNEGTRPTLANYLDSFADILSDSKAKSELAFEEYRLRSQASLPVSKAYYTAQFGIETSHWPELATADQTGTAAESNSTSHEQRANLPSAGDHQLDFQILGELGRGSFSRVYLARQDSLASRFV